MLEADRPIKTCTDDALGYRPFAEHFAKCVCNMNPEEGIVLAINGPWGSGKTSVVNMIVEIIECSKEASDTPKRILPIRFSPWWFSGQEDLTRVFFTEIAGRLNDSEYKNIVKGFKNIVQRLSQYSDIVGTTVQVATHGVVASDTVAKVFDDIVRKGSLNQTRDKLAKDLYELQKYILVIIDDLDRLPRDEILEILRLVKSVGDLPHVIYLLVFDRDVVTKACENDLFGLGGGWLDKIIQASFDLPPIDAASLDRVFIARLNGILGDKKPPDLGRWHTTFGEGIRPWLKTPRDIVRLLNAFNVSWNAVRDDVDFADFLALETLRLFAPEVYGFVRANGELISEGGISYVFDSDKRGELLKRMLASTPDDYSERVTRLLATIFPVLSSSGQYYTTNGALYMDYSKQKRACVLKYFSAYFGFCVGDNALSASEVNQLIRCADDRDEFLGMTRNYVETPQPNGGTRAALLLDQLLESVHEIPENVITTFLKNLIDSYDYFSNQFDIYSNDPLTPPVGWRFLSLIKSIIGRLPVDQGAIHETVYRDIFCNGTSLFGLTVVLGALRRAVGRDGSVDVGSAEAWRINESLCEELQSVMLERLHAAAHEGRLLDNTDAYACVALWSKLEPDAARQWASSLFEKRDHFVRFLEMVTEFSQKWSSGDPGPTRIPSINKATLGNIVDLGVMIQRAQLVAQETLNQKEREIVNHFLTAVDNLDNTDILG